MRQEYERYLPLPRLGEGRGEALAVGSWIRPPPVRPLPREDLPKGIGLCTSFFTLPLGGSSDSEGRAAASPVFALMLP